MSCTGAKDFSTQASSQSRLLVFEINMIRHTSLALALAISPYVLMAQDKAPSPSTVAAEADDEPDIIVTAQRQKQRGAVLGDIKPELQLGPADIRSLGVSSISDILTELAPQLTSGRGGTPVVLLNGRRTSGFSEIRDIPAEAIARLDILPEEVALKYGYTADQKVLNVVLRQRFKAYTAELDGGLATEGGGLNGQADVSYLRIRKNARFNLDLKYSDSAALFENERGVIPTPVAGAGSPALDMTAFRTLSAASKDFSANAVYADTILNGVSMSVNGRLDVKTTDAKNGLPLVVLPLPSGTLYGAINSFGALTQNSKAVTGHLSLTLNADLSKKWHWSFTSNYDLGDSNSAALSGVDARAFLATNPLSLNGPIAPGLITLNPANLSHSLSNSIGEDLLLYGTPFKLPAGDVSVSVKVAANSAIFDSDSSRYSNALNSVVLQAGHSVQNNALGQINLDLPITGGRHNFMSALGDLTLNANAAAQRYPSFGTLTTLGYGLNWTPVSPLTLIASMTTDHAAPSASQLTNPQSVSPGQILLNPLTGGIETVTQISGGNPNLVDSTRHVMKLEANFKPFTKTDLTFNATFTRTNVYNPIMAPTLAEAFAAETVDHTIDLTPRNFTRSEDDQLRLGFNFSKPIKSSRKPPPGGWASMFGNRGGGPGGGDGGRKPDGDHLNSGGGGSGGRGGGGFGGANRPGGGRFNVAIYDTITLHDTLQLPANGPTLNVLSGDQTGASGGQVQHDVSLQLGLSKDGFGARLSGKWQSATNVLTASPTSTLHFGSLATANLRLFVNLGQQPKLVTEHPWLRGTRVTFSVSNLFDSHQVVTDGTGAIPLSYQPAYLDATGRTIRFSIRKLF